MSRGNGKGCNESTKNNFTKILLLHKGVWIVFVLCPSLLLPGAISVLTNEPNLGQSTEMIFRLESSKISLPLCLGSHLKMQTARGVYITRRGRRWIMAWSSVHYASLINAAGASKEPTPKATQAGNSYTILNATSIATLLHWTGGTR